MNISEAASSQFFPLQTHRFYENSLESSQQCLSSCSQLKIQILMMIFFIDL